MISIANVGQTDKMIRLIAGLGLGAVSFLSLDGTGTVLGIAALIVSIVLIATGAFNFCPAYKLLGIKTNKTKS